MVCEAKEGKNEHYRLKSFAYNKKNAKTVPENRRVVLVNVNVGNIKDWNEFLPR